ncbi:hypothetical protein [Antarcticirhabdus aurantiaca]|uniref:Uncharacterized protein n=1 Tax=Antarcticirhabdus aurantiaca TaxID=2606717 RepID=A0ACD4NM84_9HYPH|nr:hypothetical protein [Antarcticirhabdus aurantiaca]WAJ28005.1 hypothetical protein OXU80_24780 [Jeongeuplla avenae]
MIGQRSAANLLLLTAGLVIWSSAFVTLYAALSIGCAFGWEAVQVGPVSLQRLVLVGLWLAHLALIAGLVLWMRGRARRASAGDGLAGFFGRTSLWASLVALAATLVNYAPILGLSACL